MSNDNQRDPKSWNNYTVPPTNDRPRGLAVTREDLAELFDAIADVRECRMIGFDDPDYLAAWRMREAAAHQRRAAQCEGRARTGISS